MKKRLKEMEDEASALREMQAKVEQETDAAQGYRFSFYSLEFCSWVSCLFLSE